MADSPGCCAKTEWELLVALLEQDQAIFDRLQSVIVAVQSGEVGDLGSANFVYNEVPAGAVNGVNTVYTLTTAPIAGKQHVSLNGLHQNPGAGNDYTIAGAVITFSVAPGAGSVILVDYIKV